MFIAATSLAAYGTADTLAVSSRLMRFTERMDDLTRPLYSNPAAMHLLGDCSIGVAGAGAWNRDGAVRALDNADADNGRTIWHLGAGAYLHSGKSTVWGEAEYVKVKSEGRNYCLNADYDLVYPYLVTTLEQTDITGERYRFNGGWGGRIGQRWLMGAALDFVATHEHRTVDPRPRNIAGDLALTAGGAFRFSDSYLIGMDLSVRRYSQSNSIMFVSEMGHSTIYHLTGCGTMYKRFAGLANKMIYTAYEPEAGAQIMPLSGKGWFFSVRYADWNMRCVLSDLNNLPMSTLRRHSFDMTGGWISRTASVRFGIAAFCMVRRGKGKDNIFGEASSGSYPQIGSQQLYNDFCGETGLKLSWRFGNSRRWLNIIPLVSFVRRSEEYDRELRSVRSDRWRIGSDIQGAACMRKGVFMSLGIGAFCHIPSASSWNMPGTDNEVLRKLADNLYEDFRGASGALQNIGVEWSASVDISGGRYALGVNAGWSYVHSSAGGNYNSFSAKLQFLF